MASHGSRVIAGLFCSLLAVPASAQYKSVFVNGSESGQGTAVTRGLDCLVITAQHVVAHPTATVVGEYGKTSAAVPIYRKSTARDGEVDLAVLKVRDGADICNADTYLHFDVDRVIAANTEGILRLRERNGAEYQIRVSLRRSSGTQPRDLDDRIRVFSLTEQPTLAKGHSGGMLYVGGQPVGILTDVITVGPSGGYVLRIDRIGLALADVVPLVAPPEDVAELNDAVASEMLTKNVNALATPGVCVKLWELAKWVARPEEKTMNPSVVRRSASGGMRTDNRSLLFPTMNTAVTLDGDASSFMLSATTLVGFVPRTTELDPIWRLAEGAIDRCLRSDARNTVGDVKLKAELSREPRVRRTAWGIETTKGLNRETTIWLKFAGRRLELSVWRGES